MWLLFMRWRLVPSYFIRTNTAGGAHSQQEREGKAYTSPNTVADCGAVYRCRTLERERGVCVCVYAAHSETKQRAALPFGSLLEWVQSPKHRSPCAAVQPRVQSPKFS